MSLIRSCKVSLAILFGSLVLFAFISPCFSVVPTSSPSAFIEWNGWKIPVNRYGNLDCRYLAEDEWENVLALEKLALTNKNEPVVYKVLYCLSTSTEMTRLNPDGSIEIQRAQMTPAQADFCRKSFEQFKRMVFAYTGGNVKIESTERDLDTPFKGEYSSETFFITRDYIDLGDGIDPEEFDLIVANFYPGPVTMIKASMLSGNPRWGKGIDEISIAYDPALEVGDDISYLAKRILREWCDIIYLKLIFNKHLQIPDIPSLEKTCIVPEQQFFQNLITANSWHEIISHKVVEASFDSQNEKIDEEENGGNTQETTQYYSYDNVKDNFFRKLPSVGKEEIEKITGCEFAFILGNDDFYFFDVSKAQGISSAVLNTPDEKDFSLNNEINFANESMAFIRFTGKDGEQHDFLFVRIDMLEPILDLLRIPSDKKDFSPRNRILGHFGRVVVIDTFLGDLPPNELGLLMALDSHVSLDAKTSKHRIIKGEKGKIAFIIGNIGTGIIDAGALTLSGFPDGKTPKIGNIYNLGEGELHNLSIDIPTENVKSGTLVLSATLDYEIGADKFAICKPVVFDICEPVEAVIVPEHTNLISKSEFNLLVTLRNNTGLRERGEVELSLPDKWKARPSSYDFDMKGLDEVREFKFVVTIKDDNPNGDYAVGVFLKIKDRKTKGPASVCHVRKSFGSSLLKYSFDKAIEGDFAVADGLFKVSLSREKPFAGSACLKIEDEGGSHYGHVGMFSQEIFRPDNINAVSSYSFDTEDYPILDFSLRHNLPDVNLGITVILDDNNPGYGILLNGEWDNKWIPEEGITDSQSHVFPVIAKIPVPADDKWHRVVIDLDKALDEYLGSIPHRVIKIRIGDTREMDFGWWKDTDKRTFYIDEFSIRKR